MEKKVLSPHRVSGSVVPAMIGFCLSWSPRFKNVLPMYIPQPDLFGNACIFALMTVCHALAVVLFFFLQGMFVQCFFISLLEQTKPW